MLCNECGSNGGGTARGLYWHYRIEHKYNHSEAYETVGNTIKTDVLHIPKKREYEKDLDDSLKFFRIGQRFKRFTDGEK